ncbi:hypothetical protein R6Q59_033440 [Mikania micrantha]
MEKVFVLNFCDGHTMKLQDYQLYRLPAPNVFDLVSLPLLNPDNNFEGGLSTVIIYRKKYNHGTTRISLRKDHCFRRIIPSTEYNMFRGVKAQIHQSKIPRSPYPQLQSAIIALPSHHPHNNRLTPPSAPLRSPSSRSSLLNSTQPLPSTYSPRTAPNQPLHHSTIGYITNKYNPPLPLKDISLKNVCETSSWKRHGPSSSNLFFHYLAVAPFSSHPQLHRLQPPSPLPTTTISTAERSRRPPQPPSPTTASGTPSDFLRQPRSAQSASPPSRSATTIHDRHSRRPVTPPALLRMIFLSFLAFAPLAASTSSLFAVKDLRNLSQLPFFPELAAASSPFFVLEKFELDNFISITIKDSLRCGIVPMQL